mmetsp:Transcript_116815/g.362987  ORF Transcript_116815/g.362987 Transcript_116815/m.362987 type:complete len:81 (+) Transcript_116815:175-417(+)
MGCPLAASHAHGLRRLQSRANAASVQQRQMFPGMEQSRGMAQKNVHGMLDHLYSVPCVQGMLHTPHILENLPILQMLQDS